MIIYSIDYYQQVKNVRGLTVQLDKGLKTGITVKACLN